MVFKPDDGYTVTINNQGGKLEMDTRQRLKYIKLAEKIGRQPEYARSLGVSVCMQPADSDMHYRTRSETQDFRYISTDKQ